MGGRRSSHRRGRGPAGDRLARGDVAARRARAADRRGGVGSRAGGDRRARRGAAGGRVDGGERGAPRRRRPASVRRQRARRARARRGGRRSAPRRAPAADLRRRCGCARDAAGLRRRGDGCRRRQGSCSARRSVAISAGGRSVCPMPSAPCITRPRCSRPTIWSPCPAPPMCCSRVRACPTRWRRCGRSRKRRSPTCIGWGREPLSPAPRFAATHRTIDRNLSAIAAADPELLAPYVALCRAAMMVAGDRLAAPARPAIEEVLARWS